MASKSKLAMTKGISIYYQIKEDILSKINSGEWKVGEKIPTEHELSDFYGVSRMTLRNALNDLAEEGVLYKERGVGTFATKKQILRSQEYLMGFYEEMKSLGYTTTSKVRQKDFIKSKNIAKNLKIDADEDIFYIQRVRYVDNQEILLDETYLIKEIGEKIADFDFEKESLFNLIESNGHILLHGDKELQIVLSNKEIADLLDVKIKIPLFFMKTLLYNNKGLPISFSESYIRNDRYRIRIHSKR